MVHWLGGTGRAILPITEGAVKTLAHKTVRLNMLATHYFNPIKPTLIYLEVQHVWCGAGLDHHSDCTEPTVKHRGVSVLIWGCMSTKGVEMTFRNGTMNATFEVVCPEGGHGEKVIGTLKPKDFIPKGP
uniref:Uncharacterized protein n=1 Tax=Seriola dumerili TaxID=41447 RepID=A0A3B4TS28_SERDU